MAKKTAAKKTAAKTTAAKTTAAKKTTKAKKTAATTKTPTADEFGRVFDRLRGVLARHVAGYVVKHDGPGDFYVDTTATYKGRPVFFAAVRRGKAYVSYHLFPVYVFPDLLHGASTALKKRMQGKACFNFKAVDEDAFEELEALTRRGREAFASRPLPGS